MLEITASFQTLKLDTKEVEEESAAAPSRSEIQQGD